MEHNSLSLSTSLSLSLSVCTDNTERRTSFSTAHKHSLYVRTYACSVPSIIRWNKCVYLLINIHTRMYVRLWMDVCTQFNYVYMYV